MAKFILSLDQGTTSSRAICFDHQGHKVVTAQQEFRQIFPRSGWVEHDPRDIWESQRQVMLEAAEKVGEANIAAIGITNQRETTIVWDAASGEPVYNAIVWQDRRTADYCASIKHKEADIKRKTGLLIDPYFSGTKIKWILDNVPGAMEKAQRGELRFGTVDSWLVWKLTGGKVHITDVSNASRTMIFNIHTLSWDNDLLELFGIPQSMLPQVCDSSQVYGYTQLGEATVPIASVIGDQQGSLFGQMCVTAGDVKNTYGTGCFLLMNTGSKPVDSRNRLLSSVGWKIGDTVNYVLEGSVFVAGASIQWLRDGLGIIDSAPQVEELASQVPDSGGVCFVPALTGLGAPYWNSEARGLICGISRGTTAAHIARATLEGIAFSVSDVVEAMTADMVAQQGPLMATINRRPSIKVDGGASRNNLLMQIQADILGMEVVRPCESETTALGAAYLAGLAVGMWDSVEALQDKWSQEKSFHSRITAMEAEELREDWHKAVSKVIL